MMIVAGRDDREDDIPGGSSRPTPPGPWKDDPSGGRGDAFDPNPSKPDKLPNEREWPKNGEAPA
jgi:hypothetical protein